ncbi:MAG TPA: polysaccharide deacetylase family protein [Acidimicrobiales bacterium]|nr:polysaccharide deacetylase family protein [Acidimicrobiales bacterium]
MWAVAALAVAVVTAVPSLQGSTAAAATSQPAFYTYQSPGGAATAGKKVIALTFDDGPGPYTPLVLSVLERYHVPATFFEVGENIAAYPQVTTMLAQAGYPVEDHTWTHSSLATLPVSQYPYEIDQTQNEIRSLTGATPACVRPPYDAWDATAIDQLSERGLTMMSYSIDPEDWTVPGVQTIVNRVVGAAFPGAVVDMHDAGGDRSETVAALPGIIGALQGRGYSFVSICGAATNTSAVYGFGIAPAPGPQVTWSAPFVAIAASPASAGYWLAAADGSVFDAGAAQSYGSLPERGITPASPVVGMAPAPDGRGYWLAAADGGVFAFGDAGFYGSMGGSRLDRPIVAMAPAPDGRGYWLAAADGGVFAFGDARFYGSMGGTRLAAPVIAMTSDALTGGYWLAAADGGVFAFHSPFLGSRGGGGAERFVSISAWLEGLGYLLAGQSPG